MILQKKFSAPGLVRHAALKKNKVIIYYLFIDMQKAMKDYDTYKESSYLQYWDVNYLYGWAMLQKLTVNNFEWINLLNLIKIS